MIAAYALPRSCPPIPKPAPVSVSLWAESGLAAARHLKRLRTFGGLHSRPSAAIGWQLQMQRQHPALRTLASVISASIIRTRS